MTGFAAMNAPRLTFTHLTEMSNVKHEKQIRVFGIKGETGYLQLEIFTY